jgi:periplasmic copper chaperone A
MFARSLLVVAMLAAGASVAGAHPSIVSGPGFANKTQKITFGIGHGCEGADTIKIKIDIPAGVTSVRAVTSDFGRVSITKVGTNVTSVTWTKAVANELPEDLAFYELTIRARVADVPFTKIQFNVIQTCRDANGQPFDVPWDQPPGSTTGEPAPLLTVVPARTSGWNKFVLPVAVTAADLPTYFGDALIAWKGTAAYSSNANTAAQIGATTGVTMLATDLAAADEIWVRY